MGCSTLNANLFSKNMSENPFCECGENESEEFVQKSLKMSRYNQSLVQNCKDSRLIQEIRREIDREKKLTRLLKKSVEQWDSIISDLDRGYGNKLTVKDDCKIRCMQQRIYNESLQQQITSLKTELRMLKHRRSAYLSSTNLHAMKNKDMRQHMENLQKELSSLKGLRSMYERQLDQESEKYFKAKEQRDSIIKDVWFQQQSRIDEQEKADKIMIQRHFGTRTSAKRQNEICLRPKTGKSRRSTVTLPPINGSMLENQRQDSYLSIHDKNQQNEREQRKKRSEECILKRYEEAIQPESDNGHSVKRGKKNLRVRISETHTEFT